jgi:very-short-patch-repair endonuclease
MNADDLPAAISRDPFSLASGTDAGLSLQQLRSRRFSAPRYGVRVLPGPSTDRLRDLREYAARMPEGAAFCGATAARIYGLPHPELKAKPATDQQPEQHYDSTEESADTELVKPAAPQPLHVAIPAGRSQPIARDVRGHRIDASLLPATTFEGLPVLSPLATFVACCRELSLTDAVVMLDALLTDKAHYPGLQLLDRPVTTRYEVERMLEDLGPLRGIRVARAAAERARPRVASPMETRLRLLLVDGGLPEPEVNVELRGRAGERLAEVDLLYREERLVIEYEGDGHRTSSTTFRNDLERERRLRANEYEYVRVTVEAMRDAGLELVADIRRQLDRRIRTLRHPTN